jgi:hypothetical protein
MFFHSLLIVAWVLESNLCAEAVFLTVFTSIFSHCMDWERYEVKQSQNMIYLQLPVL